MMTADDFKFSGPRLDSLDYPRIGSMIGVGEDIIHAFMDTETAGKSTDAKGRIKILYEPHVAYRVSKGAVRDKLVKAGLAYKNWGEKPYPKDSYVPFLKAAAIDERVAIMSCSWGFPQILGENYSMAGYDTPQAMVSDFLKDEDNQLEAMVTFMKEAGMDDELRVIEAKLKKGQRITPDDCRAAVRIYNGKGYERNGYHTKFAANLNKWAKIPDTPWDPPKSGSAEAPVSPSVDLYDGKVHEEIRSVQIILDEIGYPEVGATDGKWGTKTAAAVLAFRLDNGLQTADPRIDSEFLAKLALRPKRPIAPERANATVSDLRAKDDDAIRKSDKTKVAIGLMGGVVAVPEMIEKGLSTAETYTGYFGRLRALIDPVTEFVTDNAWLIVGAGTIYGVYKLWDLDVLRLKKHQTGGDVTQ